MHREREGRKRKTRPRCGRAGRSCAVFLRGVDGGDPDFFSSVHLPSVSVSLQYPLSMRIHDYRFPESASFERKEQGVREEGKSKIDKSLSKLVDFGAKKNTNHPKRVIGIFGGGRWIRTIEGIASRFTVCPLWPLGNSPICNFVRRWSW